MISADGIDAMLSAAPLRPAGQAGDGRRRGTARLPGVAVHDGWSPYWAYAAVHALCGAHLLRELEGIAQEPGQGWAAGMAELLGDAKLACDRARQAGCAQVDDQLRARLKARYQRLLADGQAANPPRLPGGQVAAVDARGVRRRPGCWAAWTPTATRSCGSWTTCGCRSPTTRPNATCAW